MQDQMDSDPPPLTVFVDEPTSEGTHIEVGL
jgi:hypothetical protein